MFFACKILLLVNIALFLPIHAIKAQKASLLSPEVKISARLINRNLSSNKLEGKITYQVKGLSILRNNKSEVFKDAAIGVVDDEIIFYPSPISLLLISKAVKKPLADIPKSLIVVVREKFIDADGEKKGLIVELKGLWAECYGKRIKLDDINIIAPDFFGEMSPEATQKVKKWLGNSWRHERQSVKLLEEIDRLLRQAK